NRTVALLELHGRRAGRGAGRTPNRTIVMTQRWPRADRCQRQVKIEGTARLEARLSIRSHSQRLLSERHRESEGCSSTVARFNGQVAIVHAGDLFRKPQAEAGALHVHGGLDAAESREQLCLVLLRDAHTMVAHRNASLVAVAPDLDIDVGT